MFSELEFDYSMRKQSHPEVQHFFSVGTSVELRAYASHKRTESLRAKPIHLV